MRDTSRAQRVLERALVGASGAVLLLGVAYVGWRMVTPAECAWVGANASAWLDAGVRPTVDPGAADCPVRAGETIVGAEPDGDRVLLTRDSGETVSVPLEPPGPQLWGRLVGTSPTLAFCLGLAGVSAYAALRRRQRGALTLLLMSSALLGSTLAFAAGLPVHAAFSGAARWLFVLDVQAVFLLVWGAGAAWLWLFPTPLSVGRAQHRGWLLAVLAPVTLWALAVAGSALRGGGFTGWMHDSILVQASLTLAVLGASLVLLVVRVRRALAAPPGDVPRQQVLWVAGSALVAGLLTLGLWMIPQYLTDSPLLPDDLIGAPGLALVVGLAVAVTRYRLFDLDVVLGRTLVYAVLVLVAVAVYLVVTATVAALVGSRTPTPVVAAVVVALLLNPVRVRLERLVDRAFYGERNDPYAALSRLATRIADRETPLPEVAADVARALRTNYVAIRAGDAVAESGVPPARELLSVPVRHDEVHLGSLEVAPRVAGERFSGSERRLLDDLAQQIGHRIHERRLVQELHESRERIVTAREEERRVLRRTLHDEVGPTMAAISLRAETVRRLLGRRDAGEPADRDGVEPVLAEIAQEASTTAQSLRELSYRLRPPELDEHGLVEALRRHARGLAPLEVSVTGPEPSALQPLSAAVEAAAYRIAVAALANVGAHAEAQRCRVRVDLAGGELSVVVEDDGVGVRPGTPRGVGLSGMTERATELGGTLAVEPGENGGLRVRALIPTGAGR